MAALPDDHWTRNATGDDRHQVFGLFDGERLVGITGVFVDDDDPAIANLGMSYLLPEYRRRGFGARFYEVRLAWLRERPQIATAVVAHRGSNDASRRVIVRHGFRKTRVEPHVWPDGVTDDDVMYELSLHDERV